MRITRLIEFKNTITSTPTTAPFQLFSVGITGYHSASFEASTVLCAFSLPIQLFVSCFCCVPGHPPYWLTHSCRERLPPLMAAWLFCDRSRVWSIGIHPSTKPRRDYCTVKCLSSQVKSVFFTFEIAGNVQGCRFGLNFERCISSFS